MTFLSKIQALKIEFERVLKFRSDLDFNVSDIKSNVVADTERHLFTVICLQNTPFQKFPKATGVQISISTVNPQIMITFLPTNTGYGGILGMNIINITNVLNEFLGIRQKTIEEIKTESQLWLAMSRLVDVLHQKC